MVVAYVGAAGGLYPASAIKPSRPRSAFSRPIIFAILSLETAAAGAESRSAPRRRRRSSEGPPVNFTPKGGKTERDDAANLLLARQSPGFPLARAIDRRRRRPSGRGDRARFTRRRRGSCACKSTACGTTIEPHERADGDAMLAVFKTIAALNVNERSAKQEGTFGAEFNRTKYAIAKSSAKAPQTGERVFLQTRPTRSRANGPSKNSACGPKSKSNFAALLDQPQGVVLFLGAARRRLEHDDGHRHPLARSVSCATWSSSKTPPVASTKSKTPP